MNRLKAKRWLNEYLDGEIGLADKAEFERMMAQDPELRQEYEQLRKISLLMSSGPEVEVHPSAFRAKLMDRIVPQQRYNFTPQRAFAGSMLVALLVVTIAFFQYIYSRAVENNAGNVSVATAGLTSESTISINASASQFLNATLQRVESGDSRAAQKLVEQIDRQAGLYEGAFCTKTASGNSYIFPGGLPGELNIRVDAMSLGEIQQIVSQYPGSSVALVDLADGSQLSLRDYGVIHPMGRIDLRITFNRP